MIIGLFQVGRFTTSSNLFFKHETLILILSFSYSQEEMPEIRKIKIVNPQR